MKKKRESNNEGTRKAYKKTPLVMKRGFWKERREQRRWRGGKVTLWFCWESLVCNGCEKAEVALIDFAVLCLLFCCVNVIVIAIAMLTHFVWLLRTAVLRFHFIVLLSTLSSLPSVAALPWVGWGLVKDFKSQQHFLSFYPLHTLSLF